MKNAVPWVSLCCAVVALGLSLRSPAPVEAPAPVEPSRDAEDVADLRRRLDALDDDARILWDRVSTLERRPAGGGGVAVGDAGSSAPGELVADVARLKEEVRSVMAGEVLSTEAGRTAMKDIVREVEADRQRERQVQQQQRREARAAEQKAKWTDFAKTARLTYAQEQTLTQRLAAEDALRQQLTATPGGDPREAFRTLREEQRKTDALMAQQLDEQQKQQYEALRSEERGGGRGRERGQGAGGQGGRERPQR